ncbi:EAL domain-containing protein [Vibrio harveyi]|uniref:Diguanylate phosphodiesterase n=2 Tax=Vibrio harveyi TaxID=669 RepID=A0ABN4L9U6_VIBHA|nr:EAL domain-containing protein [Vibrio harveyi]AMG01372.1 diguanylate phosphodiesterase [Vibrio harveyi]ELE7130618.1 PTS sugar transporter subunit IIC/EAL domain-containing protein [Vibrio harveyi]MCQ9076463.1 PTS sugar transporter subunit IIC/EAL domain-containing protein [Vibrio harveyi]HDM8191114.1 PTS sugar transporter subunit IIC/EAL domain-containing protein [Vibrio harveyi]
MQTGFKIKFSPSQRLFALMGQWQSASKSYLTDLASIALLLLPLILSNALAVFFGHVFRFTGLADFSQLLFHVSDILINLYPSAFCVVAGYYLSHKTNVSSAVFIIYSLIMFYLISIENGSLSQTYMLPNNPLLALLSATMTYVYCSIFKIRLLEPQALDFSSRLLKHVVHFFLFVLIALVMSHFTAIFMALSGGMVRELGVDPLTFKGGLIYQTVLGLLGSIGINGHNLLFAIKQQIFAATEANVMAWQTGEASLNVISQGFYDAFMSMGGSGNSISLLFCVLMFAKERNHLMLALAAMPLVIFNINEVLLFGLPIIFNPILIIPFVLVPLVSFVITFLCISSGLVPPVENIVNWMTPPLFSGYMAMGNQIEGSILQAFIIVLGIFIYRPFYLAYAGKYSAQFRANTAYTGIESSIFKSLLSNVKASNNSSISKSTAQKRLTTILREGELVMFYQKLQSTKNVSEFSYEALLRYIDKDGTLCPPTFVSDFQMLNSMPLLDKLVIEKVLADMQKMHLSKDRRIAINIAVATIEQEEFVPHLLSRLAHYGISPEWLEIEITEEAILSNKVFLIKTMEALQAQGIRIAMDDFGTGYASFPHLLKYPFDKIKLDRSLLLDANNQKGKDLYKLVAKLGHITHCEVVAEGVETQAEYDFVKRCGVDKVQGYFFARPSPLLDILGEQQEKPFLSSQLQSRVEI